MANGKNVVWYGVPLVFAVAAICCIWQFFVWKQIEQAKRFGCIATEYIKNRTTENRRKKCEQYFIRDIKSSCFNGQCFGGLCTCRFLTWFCAQVGFSSLSMRMMSLLGFKPDESLIWEIRAGFGLSKRGHVATTDRLRHEIPSCSTNSRRSFSASAK